MITKGTLQMGLAGPWLLLLSGLLPAAEGGYYFPELVSSHLEEVLLAADPFSEGGMYNYYWGGWKDDAPEYYGTKPDGDSLIMGKQVAYDAMCLGAVRFRDGHNNTALYYLSDYWIGKHSLRQIAEECYYSPKEDCEYVGYLYKSTGTGPPASEVLSVMSPYAVFDMGMDVEGGVYVGTPDGLYAEATAAVAIEGFPAMDLLFTAKASDPAYSNRWLGWFREDHMNGMDYASGYGMNGTNGTNGMPDDYYYYMSGKLPEYEKTPLYIIALADDYGRFAEYVLNEGYAGLCLLEIVQKCMPDAWALRRNDGMKRWQMGHCEIGTLVESYGLPEISDQLRLGVGDGEGAYRIQYRDWALFMPLKGNGKGDFANSVWAFGSKGATNSGAKGSVAIFGGPSMKCKTELPPPEPTCWYEGDRVMYIPELWGEYMPPVCGEVSYYSCSDGSHGGYVEVDWDDADDGEHSEEPNRRLYVYEPSDMRMPMAEDLMPCVSFPGLQDESEIAKVPLFMAKGMDPKFKNIWRGWYEDMRYSSHRRLEEDDGEARSGLAPAYWDTCLTGVEFSDGDKNYASYELKYDYLGMPLGKIVAYCLPGSGSERLNRDTEEWNYGHCEIGYLLNSSGVENVSMYLRLGVGDATKPDDPMYPDLNDWALFMPVMGNAEHGYWETNNNFANGVWAFGSKGVTNSLYDGPVYIHGEAMIRLLFRAGSENPDYGTEWHGWIYEGPEGNGGDYDTHMDEGKMEAYDKMRLSSIYMMDDGGNYAVYSLDYPYKGMTLREIVEGCVMEHDPCEVGRLERFGGEMMVSMSGGLRIFPEGQGLVFAPMYGTMEETTWAIGTHGGLNPGGMGDVYIGGGPYDCEEAMEYEEDEDEHEEPPFEEEPPTVPR